MCGSPGNHASSLSVLCLCDSTHLSPNHGAYPYPKDLFLKFVRENNGYFPVKIQALRDGTCVHANVPVYQVWKHSRGAVQC